MNNSVMTLVSTRIEALGSQIEHAERLLSADEAELKIRQERLDAMRLEKSELQSCLDQWGQT